MEDECSDCERLKNKQRTLDEWAVLMRERDEARDALKVEREIQRLMLERLGIERIPADLFYGLIEGEIERLRSAIEYALGWYEPNVASHEDGEVCHRLRWALNDHR